MKLEDLTNGTRVRGLTPEGIATVKAASWFGDHGVEVIFTDPQGSLQQRLVYRDDEESLELVQGGRPWSFDGDGDLLRLVSEAYRIHLAWLFTLFSGETTRPGPRCLCRACCRPGACPRGAGPVRSGCAR